MLFYQVEKETAHSVTMQLVLSNTLIAHYQKRCTLFHVS